jgi:fibro-slime domain-containing protein
MKNTMVGNTLVGLAACLFVGMSLMDCGPQSPVSGMVGSGGNAAGAGNGGNGAGAGNGGNRGGQTGIVHNLGGSTSTGTDTGGDDAGIGQSLAAVWPPPSPPFVNVTDAATGAYALGPPLTSSGDAGAVGGGSGTSTPATQCAALLGVVRDFKMGNQSGGHPDFETAPVADDPGIVASTLGPDGKPTYANTTGGNTPSTHGKAYFDQWYNDVPGVNMSYILALHLVNDANGTPTCAATLPNSSFFPLDNQGFGNQGQNHNFSFTTEIHTAFTYKGGEQFTFSGDDDLFVFINNQRVINKGGRHAQESQTVLIDSLGLTVGNVYDIAVFHAERHTNQSNFEIQTTLSFVNCGKVNNIIY